MKRKRDDEPPFRIAFFPRDLMTNRNLETRLEPDGQAAADGKETGAVSQQAPHLLPRQTTDLSFMPCMPCMPQETLTAIFWRLAPVDRASASCVSKAFHRAVDPIERYENRLGSMHNLPFLSAGIYTRSIPVLWSMIRQQRNMAPDRLATDIWRMAMITSRCIRAYHGQQAAGEDQEEQENQKNQENPAERIADAVASLWKTMVPTLMQEEFESSATIIDELRSVLPAVQQREFETVLHDSYAALPGSSRLFIVRQLILHQYFGGRVERRPELDWIASAPALEAADRQWLAQSLTDGLHTMEAHHCSPSSLGLVETFLRLTAGLENEIEINWRFFKDHTGDLFAGAVRDNDNEADERETEIIAGCLGRMLDFARQAPSGLRTEILYFFRAYSSFFLNQDNLTDLVANASQASEAEPASDDIKLQVLCDLLKILELSSAVLFDLRSLAQELPHTMQLQLWNGVSWTAINAMEWKEKKRVLGELVFIAASFPAPDHARWLMRIAEASIMQAPEHISAKLITSENRFRESAIYPQMALMAAEQRQTILTGMSEALACLSESDSELLQGQLHAHIAALPEALRPPVQAALVNARLGHYQRLLDPSRFTSIMTAAQALPVSERGNTNTELRRLKSHLKGLSRQVKLALAEQDDQPIRQEDVSMQAEVNLERHWQLT